MSNSNYTVPDLIMKFTSRKFLICLAAFLFSLGTGLAGLSQGNSRIIMIGGICCVVSAALYAACEAYTDGQALKAQTTETYISESVNRNLSATTNDRLVVTAMSNAEPIAKKAE